MLENIDFLRAEEENGEEEDHRKVMVLGAEAGEDNGGGEWWRSLPIYAEKSCGGGGWRIRGGGGSGDASGPLRLIDFLKNLTMMMTKIVNFWNGIVNVKAAERGVLKSGQRIEGRSVADGSSREGDRYGLLSLVYLPGEKNQATFHHPRRDWDQKPSDDNIMFDGLFRFYSINRIMVVNYDSEYGSICLFMADRTARAAGSSPTLLCRCHWYILLKMPSVEGQRPPGSTICKNTLQSGGCFGGLSSTRR